MRRAATSISLNIAGCTGKTGVAEKKRYYSIARGSTLECTAIFDLLKAWNLVDQSVLKTPTSLLSSLAAMLLKLVFKGYPVSERDQVTGSGSRSRAGAFHLMYPHLSVRNQSLKTRAEDLQASYTRSQGLYIGFSSLKGAHGQIDSLL